MTDFEREAIVRRIFALCSAKNGEARRYFHPAALEYAARRVPRAELRTTGRGVCEWLWQVGAHADNCDVLVDAVESAGTDQIVVASRIVIAHPAKKYSGEVGWLVHFVDGLIASIERFPTAAAAKRAAAASPALSSPEPHRRFADTLANKSVAVRVVDSEQWYAHSKATSVAARLIVTQMDGSVLFRLADGRLRDAPGHPALTPALRVGETAVVRLGDTGDIVSWFLHQHGVGLEICAAPRGAASDGERTARRSGDPTNVAGPFDRRIAPPPPVPDP